MRPPSKKKPRQRRDLEEFKEKAAEPTDLLEELDGFVVIEIKLSLCVKAKTRFGTRSKRTKTRPKRLNKEKPLFVGTEWEYDAFDAELLRFALYAFFCASRSIKSKKTPSRQMW